MITSLLLAIARLDLIIWLIIVCSVAVFGWWYIRQIMMDAIAIYQAWQTVQADKTKRLTDDRFEDESRRVKLAVWQKQARAALIQQRSQLQLTTAKLWQAGAFDVEIE